MNSDRESYVLKFTELRDPSFPARPVAVRVRQLLKMALRSMGLRCDGIYDGNRVEIVTRSDVGGSHNSRVLPSFLPSKPQREECNTAQT